MTGTARSTSGWATVSYESGEGQTRHIYLVMLAHSLLVSGDAALAARANGLAACRRLSPEACRAVLRRTLGDTIAWAIERATSDGWNREQIEEYLVLT